jgi:hypothetical protein
MKKNDFAARLAAPLILLCLGMPVFADTTAPAATLPTCKDGTTSTVAGKGACSHHGGVMKPVATAATPAPAAAAAAPAAASPAPAAAASASASPAAPAKSAGSAAGTDPTGATAKCKDGTYSHAKSHSGACSHHGGVADWLTAAK